MQNVGAYRHTSGGLKNYFKKMHNLHVLCLRYEKLNKQVAVNGLLLAAMQMSWWSCYCERTLYACHPVAANYAHCYWRCCSLANAISSPKAASAAGVDCQLTAAAAQSNTNMCLRVSSTPPLLNQLGRRARHPSAAAALSIPGFSDGTFRSAPCTYRRAFLLHCTVCNAIFGIVKPSVRTSVCLVGRVNCDEMKAKRVQL